ncbi:MAG: response regulator [Methanimicrococcus sp.]|nr:response regulator [Methanimicrococcus sp.]
MKLRYNILWLDDRINDFIDDDWLEKVKVHLSNHGFEPSIISISNSDDFERSLNEDFDLMLIDYNLVEDESTGKNGDQIIQLIRQSNISTEILFYTAKKLRDIGQINRSTFLETSKFSSETHHKSVYNEIIKLIDLTIQKFQHIIAMRGMIMHETSSLDAAAFEIINSCTKCAELDTEQLSKKIFDEIATHLRSKSKYFEKCKLECSIDDLMADPLLFSSYQQSLAIGEILNQLDLDDFSREYHNEIIIPRNIFAHSVLCNENGIEYFKNKKKNVSFNSEKCKEIRENIRKHKKNLEKLESEVKKIS